MTILSLLFGGVWGFLKRAFGFLASLDPRTLIAIVAGLAAAYFAWGERKAKQATVDCQTRHAAFIDNLEKQTAKVNAAQQRIKDSVEAKDKALQEANDREYAALSEADRLRGDAYKRANRVPVRTQRSSDNSRSGTLPIPEAVSEGGNGPGENADMVAISSLDFDICTENSRRLFQAHKDAVDHGAVTE